MVLLVVDQETGDPGICVQLSWLAEDVKKSCSLFVLGRHCDNHHDIATWQSIEDFCDVCLQWLMPKPQKCLTQSSTLNLSLKVATCDRH